jgi:hypothetical protein
VPNSIQSIGTELLGTEKGHARSGGICFWALQNER